MDTRGGGSARIRPRIRWLDEAESDLQKAGIRRWHQKAEDREEWHPSLNVVYRTVAPK